MEACLVMISGCCGGGKSTLVAELARLGFATVAEPGRRILAEERSGDGRALPWIDPAAFGKRALAMSVADHEAARGLTFFDRGVVDAGVAIVAARGERPSAILDRYRYHRLFLAPPWPEIYVNDEDRRHSFEKAMADYERVRSAYRDSGYEPVLIPRGTPKERADFLLAALGAKVAEGRAGAGRPVVP